MTSTLPNFVPVVGTDVDGSDALLRLVSSRRDNRWNDELNRPLPASLRLSSGESAFSGYSQALVKKLGLTDVDALEGRVDHGLLVITVQNLRDRNFVVTHDPLSEKVPRVNPAHCEFGHDLAESKKRRGAAKEEWIRIRDEILEEAAVLLPPGPDPASSTRLKLAAK